VEPFTPVNLDKNKPCCTPSARHDESPGRTGAPAAVAAAPISAGTGPAETTGMVQLEGGRFLMGTDSSEAWVQDGEGPVREVTVSPFLIDICAVTNRQFEAFVAATNYRTEAERFGWSYVFHLLVPKSVLKKGEARRLPGLDWWLGVEGACWRRPEGPGSNIRRRLDHPVVQVSWNDAIAFCQWAGKRLPTEAEWEYAARGGFEQKLYPWGNELTPGGRHMCNIWQGQFPHTNTADDGYIATAPARSFKPNCFGLYNVSGNVWEWVQDWFSPTHHLNASRTDPSGPPEGERKMMKGGSYLCHHSYCNRYRVAARTGNTPDSATGNCGFRCVRDT
jgi:formylglycine-generating enzyme